MKKQKEISELEALDLPKLLFHYTTSKGLTGIIRDGKIWATRIDFLNDSLELQLALNHIHEEIERQLKGIENTRSKKDLEQMIKELDIINNINTSINICVASFTEKGNLLSQWRGYCEIGNGYSLGFDSMRIKNLLIENWSLPNIENHYRLLPCVYNEEKQRSLAKDLVNLTPVENLSFLREVLSFAPRIKSKKFEEEQEWRLISPPLDYKNAKFREGKFSLIPYWEFDLEIKSDTLNKIIIGPTPEPELSEISVRGLLMTYEINFVDVSYCQIPLR